MQVSVAVSDDGLSILAAANNGPLFSSQDGGASWAELTCAGSRAWSAVAIAANGLHMAGERQGYLWTNGGQGGIDGWANCSRWDQLGQRDWASVALASVSSNQANMAAAAVGDGIWTASFSKSSGDAGFSISLSSISEGAARTAGGQAWKQVSLSADGNNVVAVAPSSTWGIYRSTDGGQTWAPPCRWDRPRWGGCCHAGVALLTVGLYSCICARGSPGCYGSALSCTRAPPGPTQPCVPPCRGVYVRAYKGLQTGLFPEDYSSLALAADRVVPSTNCSGIACMPEVSGQEKIALQVRACCGARAACSTADKADLFRDRRRAVVPAARAHLMNRACYPPAPNPQPACTSIAQATGSLIITEAGQYSLFLTSDDGSRLFLDSQLLIDNGGLVSAASLLRCSCASPLRST